MTVAFYVLVHKWGLWHGLLSATSPLKLLLTTPNYFMSNYFMSGYFLSDYFMSDYFLSGYFLTARIHC